MNILCIFTWVILFSNLLVHECFQNYPYAVIFSWSHDLSFKMLQLLERRQFHISNRASLVPFVSHCLLLSSSVLFLFPTVCYTTYWCFCRLFSQHFTHIIYCVISTYVSSQIRYCTCCPKPLHQHQYDLLVKFNRGAGTHSRCV